MECFVTKLNDSNFASHLAQKVVLSVKSWRGECFKERMALVTGIHGTQIDPAESDPELDVLLRANAVVGKQRFEDVSSLHEIKL